MPRRGPGLTQESHKEAQEALDSYYRALGSFVSSYARTEGLLHLTLRIFCGLHDALGSAVLSGFRAEQTVDLINRVLDVCKKGGAKTFLARHFQQFRLITKIRNDILHYGAEFEMPNVLLVSNERDAHIPERLRETRITPHDLRCMAHDLHIVQTGLLAVLETVSSSQSLTDWNSISQTAWRYTPLQPIPLDRAPRRNPPKRSHQRPSSRG